MKKDTWGKRPKKRGAKGAWGGKPRGRKKDKFLSPKFGKPPKKAKSGWGMDGLEKKTSGTRKAGRNLFGRWIKRPSQLTLRNYYNRVGEFGKSRDDRVKIYNERLGDDALKSDTRAVALRDAAEVAVMKAELRAQGMTDEQIRIRELDLLRQLDVTRTTRARVGSDLRDLADLGRFLTGQPLSPENEAVITAAQARYGQDVEGLKELVRAVVGKPLSPAAQNNVQRWLDERKQRVAQQFGELGELVDMALSLFRK